ncbi:MAG: low molecular weight protein-tyrosine-phosphatase [Burkholderiales bacterium]
MTKILFVCMGNICRSPTAEGVLRHFARELGIDASLTIDSAGTIGFHAGEAPDKRAIQHAAKRGYDLTAIRARQINQPDYEFFDQILAMDKQNIIWLKKQIPDEYAHKLRLFLDFSDKYAGRDVPDPYYGNAKGFEIVLDMAEDGARGLIAHLLENETADLNKK